MTFWDILSANISQLVARVSARGAFMVVSSRPHLSVTGTLGASGGVAVSETRILRVAGEVHSQRHRGWLVGSVWEGLSGMGHPKMTFWDVLSANISQLVARVSARGAFMVVSSRPHLSVTGTLGASGGVAVSETRILRVAGEVHSQRHRGWLVGSVWEGLSGMGHTAKLPLP